MAADSVWSAIGREPSDWIRKVSIVSAHARNEPRSITDGGNVFCGIAGCGITYCSMKATHFVVPKIVPGIVPSIVPSIVPGIDPQIIA
jgi:NO-binding membrane sensor protein with MHYT domain